MLHYAVCSFEEVLEMSVSPVPAGFHTVNSYIVVPDSEKAMEFYGKAFGAQSIMRMPGPGGHGTMHAEIRIGDSSLMLTDENPQWNKRSALTLGGSPISMMLYVDDADASFKRAVEAGCEATFPVSDMFWGDRFGQVKDPYGVEWSIATHVEDVEPEECARRAEAWFASMQDQCG